ncbi:unnamed protein product [Urochloa humidicola]
MDLLPEELLADILRRLAPRPLAVCRSVSKDLRAAIDGRSLLPALAHCVPRGLHGIYINFVGQNRPYIFSRPEHAAPCIDAELSFVPGYGWREVVHICNGLVLLEQDWITLYVCNPATQRLAQLPPRPKDFHSAGEHLVFDPTISLHYDVISFSEVPPRPKMPINPSIKRSPRYESIHDGEYFAEEIENLPSYIRAKYDHEGLAEWPPSLYVAQVFSSRTGQWEERTYVREDDVAVTLSDVWSYPWGLYSGTLPYFVPRTNAVYWQGAFYIHCRGGFVMR